MRLPGIVPSITIALMVAGGVWWLMNFERVSEPAYTGLTGAARDDPYLALRLLLKQSRIRLEEPAINARPAQKFDRLPAGGTLLLGDRRHVLMTPERVKQIVAWVEGGGHLIVEAEYPGRADPLLTAFGVARRGRTPRTAATDKAGADKADANKDAAPPSALRRPPRNAEITTLTFAGTERALNVEFNAYQNLDQPQAHPRAGPFWVVTDRAGVRLVSGARGAGRISAISNFDFITYTGTRGIADEAAQPTHIGKHDHAEVILSLIRLQPTHASGALRLVWGNDELSLWDWLTEHAGFALISLGLLLGVWLWRVIPRFGPLEPEAPPAEQKLLSHLEASGRFYWKHMEPPEIYAKLRSAFILRLTERRPGIARRQADQRNAELARLIGARPEAVARALDLPAQSIGELVRNAVLLQRLSQKI